MNVRAVSDIVRDAFPGCGAMIIEPVAGVVDGVDVGVVAVSVRVEVGAFHTGLMEAFPKFTERMLMSRRRACIRDIRRHTGMACDVSLGVLGRWSTELQRSFDFYEKSSSLN